VNWVQIVPRLPPPEEGVGGIALALAAALKDRGFACRFVVPAPHGAAAKATGLDVTEIEPEPAALAAAIEGAERTVLHYAGYGYQPRGVPRWLAAGLARTSGEVWTRFHEVWATGPPWRSSFWLAPLQRRIVRAIGDRSARITTSLDLYARLLRSNLSGPHREIEVRPVISAVGEATDPPATERRSARLVLFGGPGVRARAYRLHSTAIAAAARSLGLDEIWDLGPGEVAPAALGPFPIRRLGALPTPEVGAVLADSAAGFLAYPLAFLGKSSVFAAYAAYGVLPVCVGRPITTEETSRTGPVAGVHFWDVGVSTSCPPGIAVAARSWYEGHSLARQVAAIAAWVGDPDPR
jgi:hypothetical protein